MSALHTLCHRSDALDLTHASGKPLNGLQLSSGWGMRLWQQGQLVQERAVAVVGFLAHGCQDIPHGDPAAFCGQTRCWQEAACCCCLQQNCLA